MLLHSAALCHVCWLVLLALWPSTCIAAGPELITITCEVLPYWPQNIRHHKERGATHGQQQLQAAILHNQSSNACGQALINRRLSKLERGWREFGVFVDVVCECVWEGAVKWHSRWETAQYVIAYGSLEDGGGEGEHTVLATWSILTCHTAP